MKGVQTAPAVEQPAAAIEPSQIMNACAQITSAKLSAIDGSYLMPMGKYKGNAMNDLPVETKVWLVQNAWEDYECASEILRALEAMGYCKIGLDGAIVPTHPPPSFQLSQNGTQPSSSQRSNESTLPPSSQLLNSSNERGSAS